jgi:thiamine biosynthesis lipoprotein
VGAAFAEAEELDRLLTTYDPGSQVMQINRSAGVRYVKVDPRVLEVLLAARKWWKISDGAFDPTVGPLLQLWGIPDEEGPGAYPPSLEQLRDSAALVGMDNLILDDISGAVRLDREGMSLDLGGIGKGFAVDAAVRILQERGVRAARVEAAGDLRVFGEPPGGGPWKIAIPHPRDPERTLTELEVEEGAVSISSDRHKRVFVRASQGYHTHVINPGTGVPVEGVALFVVLAPGATMADALCTAAFVLGRGPGLQLLRDTDGAEGIVIYFEKDRVDELKGAGTPGVRGRVRVDL